MAETLKSLFGPPIVHRIADDLKIVHAGFGNRSFVEQALDGFDSLNLIQRGVHIARALAAHLPPYPEAIDLLLRSVRPDAPLPGAGTGMASFFYLPHTRFIADFGLDHFEESMRANYVLTQLFTAEFSIRPFIERYPEAALARLAEWARDPNPHVRRLVSEGTRTRLPWAGRLKQFQKDPGPVLALLELLKDDPELYVRRSVANNLNDIGKDNPEILIETAKAWLRDATAERRWIVKHALRSQIKGASPSALGLLGFGSEARLDVEAVSIQPAKPRIGGKVTIGFTLANPGKKKISVLADLRIHFRKANGATSPKVFKLQIIDLPPGERSPVSKTVTLAQLTTRKHYPGLHRAELILNGQTRELGSFALRT